MKHQTILFGGHVPQVPKWHHHRQFFFHFQRGAKAQWPPLNTPLTTTTTTTTIGGRVNDFVSYAVKRKNGILTKIYSNILLPIYFSAFFSRLILQPVSLRGLIADRLQIVLMDYCQL